MGILIDITGKTYGVLKVLKFVGVEDRQTFWKCRCKCRKIVIARSNDLRRGKSKSCGCLRFKKDSLRLSNKAEYRAWQGAKNRCYNPRRESYSRYCARGIVVCERWRNSFQNFLEDMGKRPTRRHSLDRWDNDGNYEPENCRWATPKQQARNRKHGRALRKLTDEQVASIKKSLKSKDANLKEIAELHGVTEVAIYDIKRGRTWKEV